MLVGAPSKTKIPIDLTNRTAIALLGDIFVDEQWLMMNLRILESAKQAGYEVLDEFESRICQFEQALTTSTRTLCQILGTSLDEGHDGSFLLPKVQDFVILDAQGKELDMETYAN